MLEDQVLVKIRMSNKRQRVQRLIKNRRIEMSEYSSEKPKCIPHIRSSYQRPSPTNKYPTNPNL